MDRRPPSLASIPINPHRARVLSVTQNPECNWCSGWRVCLGSQRGDSSLWAANSQPGGRTAPLPGVRGLQPKCSALSCSAAACICKFHSIFSIFVVFLTVPPLTVLPFNSCWSSIWKIPELVPAQDGSLPYLPHRPSPVCHPGILPPTPTSVCGQRLPLLFAVGMTTCYGMCFPL